MVIEDNSEIDNFPTVILANTLRNPIIEVWLLCLEKAGARVVLLVDANPNEIVFLPQQFHSQVVFLSEGSDWKIKCETILLGSIPKSIFLWWGLANIPLLNIVEVWPSARRILCVDTFPNASRQLTEFKESFLALFRIRKIDSIIVTSMQMENMLKLRFSKLLRKVSFHTVYSPFLLESHSDCLLPFINKDSRFVFTGTTEYFLDDRKSMRKDNLDTFFRSYIDEGCEIHIREPSDPKLSKKLTSNGYSFYPDMPRETFIDGRFSAFLTSFAGHFVTYNIDNRTIARRVRNGLSSRWSVALTANTPILVPPQADFALDFFSQFPIGMSIQDDPLRTLSSLSENAKFFRDNWSSMHDLWSAEGSENALKSALSGDL